MSAVDALVFGLQLLAIMLAGCVVVIGAVIVVGGEGAAAVNLVLTPLKFLIGFVGVFWMFLAGIAYVVYLPAGWPNYKVALWTLHAPWAGAVESERIKAEWNAKQWRQCQANETTLRQAIVTQNAAVDRLAALGLRARQEAEGAVSASRSAFQRASEARGVISAPVPKADTVCEAAQVVDGRFTESLR